MISLLERYDPRDHSIYDHVKLTSEGVRQESLQKIDCAKPYNVFSLDDPDNYTRSVPEWLIANDADVFEQEYME